MTSLTRRSLAVRPMAVALALTLTTAAAPLPAASAATSDAAFTRRADAACAAAGAKVERLPAPTQANLATVLAASGRIVERLVGQLQAIHAPKAKAARYRSFVATTRRQVTLNRRLVAAVKAKDQKRVASLLRQFNQAGLRSNRLAARLKLSACARSYVVGGGGAAV
jgi:hypothetical protein